VIARIRGRLIERGPEDLVVDVAGVGYELLVSGNTLADVGPEGSQVELYVHTQVREDAITLFGFASAEERLAFRKLTSVSGVGPKLARAVLSSLSPQALAHALAAEDLATLARVPGVGKRLAQRLVVELRDAFAALPFPEAGRALAQGAAPGSEAILDDVEAALGSLGYKTAQIRKALRQLEPDAAAGEALEELIRRALGLLQGRTL